MDFTEIVQMALSESTEDLEKALSGLSNDERRFQPNQHSNHIDFTLWHMLRVEDHWICRFAQRTQTIWERNDWSSLIALPISETGYGYSTEQVLNLNIFDMDKMMEYSNSVRENTVHFLNSLTKEDLSNCPDPSKPGYSIARMLSHLIVELSQHVGQIAYLRGFQRGINQ